MTDMTRIHDRIAADIAHLGGLLRCDTCGAKEPLTQARISAHLRTGWPLCCGHTMRWITAREAARNTSEGAHTP